METASLDDSLLIMVLMKCGRHEICQPVRMSADKLIDIKLNRGEEKNNK